MTDLPPFSFSWEFFNEFPYSSPFDGSCIDDFLRPPNLSAFLPPFCSTVPPDLLFVIAPPPSTYQPSSPTSLPFVCSPTFPFLCCPQRAYDLTLLYSCWPARTPFLRLLLLSSVCSLQFSPPFFIHSLRFTLTAT